MRRSLLFIVSLLLCLPSLGADKTEKKPMPRVMLLMTEKSLGGYTTAQAELTMAQHLVDKGCVVVDMELVKAKIAKNKALQAMTGNDKAAAALGLELGADLIIVGRAIAKGTANKIQGTNMRTYTATVTAKAMKADTAEFLAAANGSGRTPHIDDTAGGDAAIKKAATTAIETLYPKIIAKWQATTAAGAVERIELVVGNVTQVWQLAAIRNALKNKVEGTQDVVQRSFTSGVAIFEIKAKSSAQKYAEGIVLIADKQFRLKIVGITANKLDAKFVEKK